MNPFFSFEKNIWQEKINVNLELNQFERVVDVPVISTGRGENPDNSRVAAPSVFHNGKHFIMWYTGLYRGEQGIGNVWEQARNHSLCIAYSDDGIKWQKPNLRFKHRKIQYEKNVILKDFYLAGVEYLEEEKKFIMALHYSRGLKKEEPQTTFCIGKSNDGLSWELKRKPATNVQHFEAFGGVKRIGERYWVVGQGISPFFHMPDGSVCGRVMIGFHSGDLKTWELYPRPLFHYPIHGKFPRSSLQVHGGATVWPRGRINIGLVGQLWPAGFSENVKGSLGLIYSYDGLDWTEPFCQEQILSPREQCWDCGLVMQGNSVYNFKDRTYHWYWASDENGNTWKAKAQIGLAGIRRDGFSYYCGEGVGPKEVLSAPLQISDKDKSLYLNGKASKSHPITVEVLDKYCRPLPSQVGTFCKDSVMQKAVDIQNVKKITDEIRVRVSWKGNRETNKFYGFYIGKDLDEDKYLNRWCQV